MCNNFLVSIQKSVIFLSDNIIVILHILRQGKFLYWGALYFFRYFAISKDGNVLSQQEGVFRTNCIDCLDRTNVVQGLLARIILETQLTVSHILWLHFRWIKDERTNIWVKIIFQNLLFICVKSFTSEITLIFYDWSDDMIFLISFLTASGCVRSKSKNNRHENLHI